MTTWAAGGRLARQLLLLFLTLLALTPVYFMAVNALKSDVAYARNPFGLPSPGTLASFQTVLDQPSFGRWMLNSVLLTVVSVVGAMVIAGLAAYAFARIPFPGAELLLRIISTLMAIPVIAVLVPLFVFMVDVRLINTYPAAILVYIGFLVPYKIYFLTAFFRQLPIAILEAATLDGCGPVAMLRYVVVPLSMPAIVAMSVVGAIWVWNDLLIALVLLQSDTSRTLMVGLTVFQDQFRINVPVTMAGLVMAVVPIALVYMFGIRYFVSGFLVGSMHGE